MVFNGFHMFSHVFTLEIAFKVSQGDRAQGTAHVTFRDAAAAAKALRAPLKFPASLHDKARPAF